MAILLVVVGAIVVFVIAAVVIGREAGRLAAAPPRPVFDVDEAVVWIADRLPDEVTAQHSHADVRRLLLWSVEHLRTLAGQERVADEAETFGYVVDRAAEAGLEWEPLEVKWVLDLQAQYLEIIGATGRAQFEDLEMPPEADS
jgi:hypothetical protein